MSYTCTECNATFSNRDDLRRHQFAHMNEDGNSAERADDDERS